MNKRKSLEKDPVLSRIRDEVIEQENELRDSYFSRRNFDDVMRSGIVYGALDVVNSLAEFVRLRKQTSAMQERFGLALKPEYHTTVSTVELGMTDDPNCHDALDALKDDYQHLLAWAVEHHYTTGEIAREDSYREFSVRPAPSDNSQAIVTRTRTLFEGTLPAHDDETATAFVVYKRMVFGMPAGVYAMLCEGDLIVEKDETKQRFEQQIDSNNHILYPIRTGYYMATEPAV